MKKYYVMKKNVRTGESTLLETLEMSGGLKRAKELATAKYLDIVLSAAETGCVVAVVGENGYKQYYNN